jgi:hypothetical protein
MYSTDPKKKFIVKILKFFGQLPFGERVPKNASWVRFFKNLYYLRNSERKIGAGITRRLEHSRELAEY